MAIRLLALDIDGTLTFQQNEISLRTQSAIRAARDAGTFVMIATGRSVWATRPVWESLGLSGPSIQFGGAWIVHAPDGKLLEQRNLSPETVRDVMQFAHDNHIVAQIYLGDTVVLEQLNPYTERYIARNGMHVCIDPDVYKKLYDDVPKILVFSEEEERVHRLFAEAFSERAHITRSESTFIEINDFAATKGRALARLAQRMGVPQSEVAAVGDSYLDIDMIQWAGTGVCMAGAVADVLNAADVVVPDSRHDGVAWFIEHYVLT